MKDTIQGTQFLENMPVVLPHLSFKQDKLFISFGHGFGIIIKGKCFLF